MAGEIYWRGNTVAPTNQREASADNPNAVKHLSVDTATGMAINSVKNQLKKIENSKPCQLLILRFKQPGNQV